MVFDVSNHALLSPAAKALGDAFQAQQLAAESELGIYGVTYTGDKPELVQLAIVEQINYRLTITPEFFQRSVDARGGRRHEHREQIITVSPVALGHLESAGCSPDQAAEYATLRSVR